MNQQSIAARGTLVLAVSQGCYFIAGYLAVVLLARHLGPAAYGAYGVIMSVLVWLEESGRSTVPSATTKLVAETTSHHDEIERSALALNVSLHVLLFLVMWGGAPWLSIWFGIENGTSLFRVAAIDLPFFGVYTAIRAIYQGHRRYYQLGITQVFYAITKLVGVLLLIRFGVTVSNALLVNVAATLVGLVCLIPGGGVTWRGNWFGRAGSLISSGAPMGLYYCSLMLRGSLVLWALKVMSPHPDDPVVGIFVAAFNIARVPALVLTTVTTVILPSISRAVALGDERSARWIISQALRFCFILYLPACLILMAEPERIMNAIYTSDFASGGAVLSLLVISEGLHVVHAILGTSLNAAGEARKAATVAVSSLLPVGVVVVVLIRGFGAIGAALANVLTLLGSSVVLGWMVRARFTALMGLRNFCNIGIAGGLMYIFFVLIARLDAGLILPYGVGGVVYLASLIVAGEITRNDLDLFWSRKNIQAYRA